MMTENMKGIVHLLPTYATPISDAVKALEDEVARMRDLCFVAGQEAEQLRAFCDSVPWADLLQVLDIAELSNYRRSSADTSAISIATRWLIANAPEEDLE